MIFCLVGKSGSGKDTLMNRLDYDKVVPYTTRDMREGEVEGREYHFVTDKEMEELDKQGKILEKRSYDTVYGVKHYFTVDDEQLNKDVVFMICSPGQYRALKKKLGDRLVAILMAMSNKDRLIRAIKRDNHGDDCRELCRRYLSDEEDFIGMDEEADYKIDSSDCLGEQILNEIHDIVKERGIRYES